VIEVQLTRRVSTSEQDQDASNLCNQMDLIYIIGPTSCGKTTVSTRLADLLTTREPGRPVGLVEADVLHPAANVAKMTRGEPLNDDDRWPWLASVRNAALEEGRRLTAENGDNRAVVCIACSGLKKMYREVLSGLRDDRGNLVVRSREDSGDLGLDLIEHRTSKESVLFIHLRTTPDLVRKRILERKGHFMNPNLVDSQFAALEEPEMDEGGDEYSVAWVEVVGKSEEDVVVDALKKVDEFWDSRGPASES